MPQQNHFSSQARQVLAKHPPGHRLAFAVARGGVIVRRAAAGDHEALKGIADTEIVEAWLGDHDVLHIATGRLHQNCTIEIDARRI